RLSCFSPDHKTLTASPSAMAREGRGSAGRSSASNRRWPLRGSRQSGQEQLSRSHMWGNRLAPPASQATLKAPSVAVTLLIMVSHLHPGAGRIVERPEAGPRRVAFQADLDLPFAGRDVVSAHAGLIAHIAH